jgi:DNA-binding transcriptional LysR family regulator
MELRHARYFIAVAEELNFRRASARLHLSQPSLSTQIRQLEEDIGVQLLKRDSHKVELTVAGRAFWEGCRRLLQDCEEYAKAARRIASGETGPLSVGFVPSLAHGWLPNVLRVFRKQFPDVELSLSEMDSTEQIEQLGNKRIELGLIGLGLPREIPELKIIRVAEEPLVVAVPEEHSLAYRRSKTIPLQALATEHFLLGSRSEAPVFNPWMIVLCQQAGFQPHVIQEAGQPVTVLNYVAAGLGITILPAQFSKLPIAGVRFLPIAKPIPAYRYFAAHLRDNQNPAVANFIQIACTVDEGKMTERQNGIGDAR